MTALIPLTIAGLDIRQDAEGRYYLNDLHKAAGGEKRHQPANWLRAEQTQALVAELENSIPQIRGVKQNQPLTVKPGAPSAGGGTYVCWELVYDYAAWISPTFRIKVIRTYHAVVTGGADTVMLSKDRYITLLEKATHFEPVFGERKPWTPEQDELVQTLLSQGLGETRIGYQMGRSRNSINHRLRRLRALRMAQPSGAGA